MRRGADILGVGLVALAFWWGCTDVPNAASAAAPSAAAPGAAAPSAAVAPKPVAPEPPPPDYEQADRDPDNDLVVAPPAPLDDCERRLTQAGVSFTRAVLPMKRERARGGEVLSCGAVQVVTYRKGPGKIRYNAPPRLTCRLALALGRLEQIAQEEAQRHLGQRIVRLTQMGSYNCRKMVRFDFVSEHSYANALDIRDFQLENGRRVSVQKHFGALDAAPTTREAEFLRALARRAFDERLFSVVLTPYWDKLHEDHFHFDLARYRVDGTRPAASP
jgi:hypothetical protein